LKSTGNDGKLLKIIISDLRFIFLATQMLNPRKTAGDPYTFRDTGTFLNNFELYINPNLTQVEILSTGGSAEKVTFQRV
jgi:hypothetical protein